MKNNQQIRRVPRPLGYTSIAYQHASDPTPEHEATKLETLIAHYVNNHYSICGTSYSIQDLAQKTQTNIQTLQKYLYQYITKLYNLQHLTSVPGFISDSPSHRGSGSPGTDLIPSQASQNLPSSQQGSHIPDNPGEALIQTGMGALLSWSLGDRALVMEQAMRLRASQGNGYKAFVSAEYNKALKLLLDTHDDMAKLIGMVSGPQGGTTIQILNQAVGPQTKDGEALDGLTTEAALGLIAANSGPELLSDPEALEGLKAQYQIEDMPEVNAVAQGTEGNVPKVQAPIPKEVSSHIDRRAQQLNVDLEADHISDEE